MCKNYNLTPRRKITIRLPSEHSLCGSADDCTSVKLNTDLSPCLSVPLSFSILLPSLLKAVTIHIHNSFSRFQLRLQVRPMTEQCEGSGSPEASAAGVAGGTRRATGGWVGRREPPGDGPVRPRGSHAWARTTRCCCFLLHLTERDEVRWSGALVKFRFLSKWKL